MYYYHQQNEELINAARAGNLASVQAAAATLRRSPNWYSENGPTFRAALQEAVSAGHVAIVDYLINNKHLASATCISGTLFSIAGMLIRAAALGKFSVVEYLLKHKATDINANDCVRAFTDAVANQQLIVAEYLLSPTHNPYAANMPLGAEVFDANDGYSLRAARVFIEERQAANCPHAEDDALLALLNAEIARRQASGAEAKGTGYYPSRSELPRQQVTKAAVLAPGAAALRRFPFNFLS